MAILILRPNADGTVQLSTSTGTDHYALVDEVTKDEADYVHGVDKAAGKYYDFFGLPDHTTQSGTINSVTVKAYAKGYSDATPSAAGDSLRFGVISTSYWSSYFLTTESTALYSNTWNTNPSTASAWTWDNIDDLIIAVSTKASGLKEGVLSNRIYQVWAEVDYTLSGWANIAKVNGIASASIAKVNGIAVASIAKINGVAV